MATSESGQPAETVASQPTGQGQIQSEGHSTSSHLSVQPAKVLDKNILLFNPPENMS